MTSTRTAGTGAMLVLPMVGVISVTRMCAIAGIVTMQKLVPPRASPGIPLALAPAGLGTAIAAT